MDIGLGPWVKNIYDGYVLMKFTSSYEWQQEMLGGKFFFNTSDYFSKCEDTGRGDLDEGTTFRINSDDPDLKAANIEIINGVPYIIVRDFSKNPSEYQKGTVWSLSQAENRFRKICCFYTEYVNVHDKKISSFPNGFANEFGQYGIMILNRSMFYDRIAKAINKLQNVKEARMGFVEYQSMKPGINDWNPFRKDKDRFEYQNEFRITFINDTVDPVKLDLGTSIRDIATPIMASDLSEIHFNDSGELIYPQYNAH